MQLKVTNLKLCITGGRGSNKEISLFLDSESCSNFRLIQHNNDYDIQVQKNLCFFNCLTYMYMNITKKWQYFFNYYF